MVFTYCLSGGWMRIDEPGIPLLMILDISNIQGSQNGVILTRQFLSLSSLIKATEHFTDKKKNHYRIFDDTGS